MKNIPTNLLTFAACFWFLSRCLSWWLRTQLLRTLVLLCADWLHIPPKSLSKSRDRSMPYQHMHFQLKSSRWKWVLRWHEAALHWMKVANGGRGGERQLHVMWKCHRKQRTTLSSISERDTAWPLYINIQLQHNAIIVIWPVQYHAHLCRDRQLSS